MPISQRNESIILLVDIHILDDPSSYKISEFYLSIIVLEVIDVFLLQLRDSFLDNNERSYQPTTVRWYIKGFSFSVNVHRYELIDPSTTAKKFNILN